MTRLPSSSRAAGAAGPATLLLGTLLLAALLLAGCGERPAPETAARAARPTASMVTVETLTVAVPLSLPAQLYVEHDAIVPARSEGIVQAVHADLGTPVRAGQVLAELESTDQSIALAQAQANFDNAGVNLRRGRELARSGSATRVETEQVEFAFRQAELGLRKARRELALTRIVAPFDGIVTGRMVRPRRMVAPGDSLFRVTTRGPLLAAVHAPDTTPVTLRPGTAVEVVDSRGVAVAGRIVRTAAAIDPASDTREAIVQLAPDARLDPGANVTVRLGAERRRVVVVPRSAVAADGYAVVWENDRTSMRAVTLGADLGNGRVEVLSGLSPGERIVPAVER